MKSKSKAFFDSEEKKEFRTYFQEVLTEVCNTHMDTKTDKELCQIYETMKERCEKGEIWGKVALKMFGSTDYESNKMKLNKYYLESFEENLYDIPDINYINILKKYIQDEACNKHYTFHEIIKESKDYAHKLENELGIKVHIKVIDSTVYSTVKKCERLKEISCSKNISESYLTENNHKPSNSSDTSEHESHEIKTNETEEPEIPEVVLEDLEELKTLEFIEQIINQENTTKIDIVENGEE